MKTRKAPRLIRLTYLGHQTPARFFYGWHIDCAITNFRVGWRILIIMRSFQKVKRGLESWDENTQKKNRPIRLTYLCHQTPAPPFLWMASWLCHHLFSCRMVYLDYYVEQYIGLVLKLTIRWELIGSYFHRSNNFLLRSRRCQMIDFWNWCQ